MVSRGVSLRRHCSLLTLCLRLSWSLQGVPLDVRNLHESYQADVLVPPVAHSHPRLAQKD